MTANENPAEPFPVQPLKFEYDASVDARRALEAEMMLGTWDNARYRAACDEERAALELYVKGCRAHHVPFQGNPFSMCRLRA